MNNQFQEFMIERVKNVCHIYIVDKNKEYILDRCRDNDVPKIGFVDPNWEYDYTIVSEHFNAFVHGDNLCTVTGRCALKTFNSDKENKETIMDGTFLCRKKDEDIEILSIHISYFDGKTLIMNNNEAKEKVFEKAINSMYEVVMQYECFNNSFSYDNERYKKFFEVETHFVSMDQWFWHMCTECVLKEDTEKLDMFRGSDINKRIRHNDNVIVEDIRIKNKQLDYIWARMVVILIPNAGGTNLERVLVMFRNINELKNKELMNETIARSDSLTGIYNRYYTEKIINEYAKDNNKIGIFILMDVDRFKNVNDAYGHITGDDILNRIVNGVKKQLKPIDVFGRIGGDEFVIFITGVTDEKFVKDKIVNILKDVSFDYSESDIDMTIHCSAGVAISNESVKTFDQLYKIADKALYEAKREGRNAYRIG